MSDWPVFKLSGGQADTGIMKVLFIILLFPSVACALWEAIPYKKNKICEKIVKDSYTARLKLIEPAIRVGEAKDSLDKHAMAKAIADLSKAFSVYSKVFKDSEKYKCLKQIQVCNESVKDATKATADLSKAWANWFKPFADQFQDKATADWDKATADINKYCK